MHYPDFTIRPLDSELGATIQGLIDQKTKPTGSLGLLEQLALQVALIQNTPRPVLESPHLLIFAGDHGIAHERVSAYPQVVTVEMVKNYLAGGAAVNVFAKQNQWQLQIVDAGVAADLSAMAGLVDQKIAKGTANFLYEPAMTQAQCTQALDYGAALVEKIHRQTGCNIVGFGEMGIGNSSAAALLTHLTTSFPLRQCVGRGTGLTEMEWREKLKILDRALHQHQDHLAAAQSPLDWLCLFGGFEIVQLCGAMLKAASLGMAIVVDGYIATAALLVAWKLNQQILPYSIFAHQSEEGAHKHVLAFLNATPLLQLRMRLGEGTGAALALPLLKAAVGFLNEMASFDSASVSNRLDKYF